MRTLKLVLLLSLSCFSPGLFAQDQGQHGIQLGDLDRKADPCTDFAQFANGTWHAQNPIPAYMDRWSRRWQAGEEAKDQLKVILEDVSRRTDWPKSSTEQLIGDYYGSCMDEARINKLGLTPAEPMLKDIQAMKTPADLQHMILRMHDLSIWVPFGLVAAPDNHNPGQTIAEVFASGLGLPDRDYYLKTEPRFQQAREKYLVHVTNMFKLAGYDEAKAKAAANTVFELEKKLAENTLDNVALRDPVNTDHKTTYVDLKKLAPAVDWDGYFTAARISHADLNVDQPKFMQEVDRQFHATPLADWKTYLTWQLLHGAADSLSDPFVKENFSFYGQYLAGAKEMKPRWKRCAEATDQLLGEALGKKYVEKYFPPEAKARAQDMVKNILAAMHDTIEGLDWMGPDTKKKALEKLSTFNPKIGYPDKWKDYSSIKLSRDSYWNNQVAALHWNVETDNWALIGKPTDRGRWGMTPPTSNAYYNPLLNEIVFPAGILQPPAFDMKATDAVNYGSIGVVIGHEISHGFDDSGAQFDAQGRLNNWWTQDDLKRFQGKTSCVVRQFDNYYIEPNIHHNGKLVLGESIGDLAGAKIAFLAFKKAQQQHPQPTIDGFTPEQQFFIAWGRWRGDEIRPETQRLMVQGDPHPIAKYRVIGPLSNLPDFAKAFSCKEGSPMVRPAADRCEIW
ncbi:MAG TPA: M13 family metallopeptidase [Candidatus Angelobacter sp.]|nr:M13 family metallopeptidase [Candidatus Angelobacter sp.]